MESLTLKDILYFIGAVTAIVSFITMISKPYKELKKDIENLKKSNDELKTSNEDLKDIIKSQQKLLNSSLKVEMLMMQHMIYGNHTDEMKKYLTELQNTIIEN